MSLPTLIIISPEPSIMPTHRRCSIQPASESKNMNNGGNFPRPHLWFRWLTLPIEFWQHQSSPCRASPDGRRLLGLSLLQSPLGSSCCPVRKLGLRSLWRGDRRTRARFGCIREEGAIRQFLEEVFAPPAISLISMLSMSSSSTIMNSYQYFQWVAINAISKQLSMLSWIVTDYVRSTERNQRTHCSRPLWGYGRWTLNAKHTWLWRVSTEKGEAAA